MALTAVGVLFGAVLLKAHLDSVALQHRINQAWGFDVGPCAQDSSMTHASDVVDPGSTVYVCGGSYYAVVESDGTVRPINGSGG